jgi:hypothetical protein
MIDKVLKVHGEIRTGTVYTQRLLKNQNVDWTFFEKHFGYERTR